MKIELTKEQYECLIRVIDAGSSVYGILGDSVSKRYKKQSDEIENLRTYFLGYASEFGVEGMAEKFHGHLIMSDKLAEKLHEAIEEYDNETFWYELEVRFGKRDFERTITNEDLKEIKARNGWLPERIHKLYEKWGNEFEKYGIERLGIVETDRT